MSNDIDVTDIDDIDLDDIDSDAESQSSNWIPIRLLIHELVLSDPLIIRQEGNWLVLDIELPVKCAPVVIVSSSNIINGIDCSPSDIDNKDAYRLSGEFLELDEVSIMSKEINPKRDNLRDSSKDSSKDSSRGDSKRDSK